MYGGILHGCGCGDQYEGQEHANGVRGQVKGDTKFQEVGYVCDGCCIPRSKPRVWHMVGAQDVFVKGKRDWWGSGPVQGMLSLWRRGEQVYHEIF